LEKGQESVTAGRKFHAIVNAFAFSVFCQLLKPNLKRLISEFSEVAINCIAADSITSELCDEAERACDALSAAVATDLQIAPIQIKESLLFGDTYSALKQADLDVYFADSKAFLQKVRDLARRSPIPASSPGG